MTPQSDETWYIVGQGAIGLLMAAHLESKTSVRLILRTGSRIGTQRYLVEDLQGKSREIGFQTEYATYQSPIHQLIIPVKAFDVLSVFELLRQRLTPDATIVLCHNGLGTIEQVMSRLQPKQSLYVASTTHGAFKPLAKRVIHTGTGNLTLGQVTQQRFNPQFPELLPNSEFTQDIFPILWKKLAINSVINPMTAIYACRNGELIKDEYTSEKRSLINEFITVAEAAGQSFDAESLLETINEVITNTARNWSSMQQDIQQKRRTEVEFINGFICNQGQALGIATPMNQLMLDSILRRSSVYLT